MPINTAIKHLRRTILIGLGFLGLCASPSLNALSLPPFVVEPFDSTQLLKTNGIGDENNFWPFYHHQESDRFGRREEINILGPIFGDSWPQAGGKILSLRPVFTGFDNPGKTPGHFHVVYPFFNFYWQLEGWNWHFLNLISMQRNYALDTTFFQAFPFIFFNHTPNPEANYFAVWPIGGVLKNRLFRDRIQFALWPLYVQTQLGDETRISTPWPFIQWRTGPKSSGFGLWPIFGHFEKENSYNNTWALWPLFYNYTTGLDRETPYNRLGVLPFYARETGAGLKSETYVWPFFGYTTEWDPRPEYHEIRYFWPFIVQGRGEEKYLNRLMPVYSNEIRPDFQKRWYLWPLLKIEDTRFDGLMRKKTSLLYFIYHDDRQLLKESVARKTFLWPLAGYWNDGNGRKQFQMLDPLSVFFPGNEKVKENWTPLFNLYRYDSRYGNSRHSLLWNLIVLENGKNDTGAFYLGPLFEIVDEGSTGHWEILKGLFGVERIGGERKFHWFWK